MNEKIKKLVISAMFVSIGILLPFFTGQIPRFGQMLLPMHIPVILCGFICGWQYGAMAGAVLPLMRFFILQTPPMPTAAFMAFELCTYGLVTGIVYSRFKKKNMLSLYCTLIIAMLAGRAVSGIVQTAFFGFSGQPYTLRVFMAGAFINAVPGIILQLLLIPSIMAVLEKTGLVISAPENRNGKETL